MGSILMLVGLAFAGPGEDVAGSEVMEDAERPVIIESRTEIDFEGVDVKGLTDKPGLISVTERPGVKFPPLFKPRESFDDRLVESVDAVK